LLIKQHLVAELLERRGAASIVELHKHARRFFILFNTKQQQHKFTKHASGSCSASSKPTKQFNIFKSKHGKHKPIQRPRPESFQQQLQRPKQLVLLVIVILVVLVVGHIVPSIVSFAVLRRGITAFTIDVLFVAVRCSSQHLVHTDSNTILVVIMLVLSIITS
jgi:hypothetical protein